MSMNKLSGIERELVLQYLIDGNVPVTITPIDDATENEEVPHLSTVVFPVAIKPDNISVLKEGIILLKNPNLRELLQFDDYDCIVQSIEAPPIYG